jgi:hypothetical protein
MAFRAPLVGFLEKAYLSGRGAPMTISVQLPDDAERRLAETAKRLNVPVHELAAAAVRDLLTQPAADFEDAATRVLTKNRELYRRLA